MYSCYLNLYLQNVADLRDNYNLKKNSAMLHFRNAFQCFKTVRTSQASTGHLQAFSIITWHDITVGVIINVTGRIINKRSQNCGPHVFSVRCVHAFAGVGFTALVWLERKM